MANNFILPSVVAKESLRILTNEMVIGNLVHRGDTSEFTGANKIGDTVTIRKPATFTVNEFTSTISAQAIAENSTTLSIEKHYDVSVEVTQKQLNLQLNDFSKQVIEPVMIQFADTIDSYLYSKYADINNIIGDGTCNAISDLALVNTSLMTQQVPNAGRVGIVGPATAQNILSIENLHRADARGDGGQAMREASLGRIMGVDYYAAQNVKSHTAGVPGGTPAATGSTAVAPNKLKSTVTIASGGAAGTFKRGDILTFAGGTETYTVVADVTLNGSGAGTIEVTPGLTRDLSGALVTVTASHKANLVGNFRGLSLVVVPLELPMHNSVPAAVVNYGGTAIRIVYDYDVSTKTNIVSFDALLGAKVTDPRMLARFNG